jgi:hypothetical protein
VVVQLIHYKAAGYCRDGSWSAKSLSSDCSPVTQLDLRNQKDADSLLHTLQEIDLSLLAEAMN